MRGRELADAKADHGRARRRPAVLRARGAVGRLRRDERRRYKTSLCKTHEERPDGGIVTMCTHGAKRHVRPSAAATAAATRWTSRTRRSFRSLARRRRGRECRAPSGGRDTTCAYAHAVVEVRTHLLTMLRELEDAGARPDLLRSTQRAGKYPESPGRMGSPPAAAQADERPRLHACRGPRRRRRPPSRRRPPTEAAGCADGRRRGAARGGPGRARRGRRWCSPRSCRRRRAPPTPRASSATRRPRRRRVWGMGAAHDVAYGG